MGEKLARLGSLGSLERGLLPKAISLNVNNEGMVNQPVDSGHGHHGIGEDVIPLTKGLIGGNKEAVALVAMGNEFKEDRGFRLRLFDIAEVIHNQQVKAVKFREGDGQEQLGFGLLKFLNQGSGARESDPFALVNGGPPEGRCEMGFAGTRGPKDEQIFSPTQPGWILRQLHQRRGIELWTVVKVKARKALACGEFCLTQRPFDAVLLAMVHLQLAECYQELGVGPVVLSRLLLEIAPVMAHPR